MNNYKQNLPYPIDDNPLWKLFEENYDKYFFDYKGKRDQVIPKKIHQVWLGGTIPDKYLSLIRSWRDIHPDWEYKLWTDDDIASFDMTNKRLFDAMDNYGSKSDIFRYEIIYRHGGLYIDTDFECIRSFNDFLHLDFFAGNGHTVSPVIFNGLFAARPNHAIMKNIIDALSDVSLSSKNDFNEIINATGPNFFTPFITDYMIKDDEKIVILPQNYFYPFPATERLDTGVRDNTDLTKAHSYIKNTTRCIHLWHTAWQ